MPGAGCVSFGCGFPLDESLIVRLFMVRLVDRLDTQKDLPPVEKAGQGQRRPDGTQSQQELTGRLAQCRAEVAASQAIGQPRKLNRPRNKKSVMALAPIQKKGVAQRCRLPTSITAWNSPSRMQL